MTEPKRDFYGRYELIHPHTGKEVKWTRATTFADAIEDSYNLTLWKQRAVAVGLGQRPDLIGLASALSLDEDKKQLDDLCKTALIVAQADKSANTGTALHKFTERLDRGEKLSVPGVFREDIQAYQNLKAQESIQMRPDYIERITVLPQFNVAGTSDRIVRMDGKVYIADLKTGQNLDYSWKKIAIQLALYAHGEGLWNPQTATYDPMPPVDQGTALVIHLPAGSSQAALWGVDIAAGWEAAEHCSWVRDWRKRKDLATPISGASVK